MRYWSGAVGLCFGFLIVGFVFHIFFEFGSRLSIIAGVVSMFFAWTFGVRPLLAHEDAADFDGENVFIYALLAIGFFIFSSASLWDPKGYCDHQRSAELVELNQTLEDRFKGKTRSDVRVYDDSEVCIAEGWDYVGQYEALLVWISGLIALPSILIFAFLAWARWKDEKDEAELALGTKTDDQPSGGGLLVFDMSRVDRIIAMRNILENIKAGEDLDWEVGDFVRLRPPATDCSEDELIEVEKLLRDMQAELKRAEETHEEKGTSTDAIAKRFKGRNAKIAKSLGPVERELAKRSDD